MLRERNDQDFAAKQSECIGIPPTQLQRKTFMQLLNGPSGRMTSIKDIRTTLKSEGYADDGQLYGRSIREQLTKLIVECGNKGAGIKDRARCRRPESHP